MVAVLPAWSQPPRQKGGGGMGRGGFGLSFLVNNKSVQDELKLSTESAEKLKKAVDEINEKFKEDRQQARKDMDREKMQKIQHQVDEQVTKVLDDTLKPDQIKRLHQIHVQAVEQMSGPAVFEMPHVAKELKLSAEQKARAKELEEEFQKNRAELFQGIGRDQEKRQEAMKKAREMAKECVDKVKLTDEQKQTWKELTGASFELRMAPPRKKDI
jgi:hypothetical protein